MPHCLTLPLCLTASLSHCLSLSLPLTLTASPSHSTSLPLRLPLTGVHYLCLLLPLTISSSDSHCLGLSLPLTGSTAHWLTPLTGSPSDSSRLSPSHCFSLAHTPLCLPTNCLNWMAALKVVPKLPNSRSVLLLLSEIVGNSNQNSLKLWLELTNCEVQCTVLHKPSIWYNSSWEYFTCESVLEFEFGMLNFPNSRNPLCLWCQHKTRIHLFGSSEASCIIN